MDGDNVKVVQQILGHALAAVTLGVYAGRLVTIGTLWRIASTRLLGGQVRTLAGTAVRRAGRPAPLDAQTQPDQGR